MQTVLSEKRKLATSPPAKQKLPQSFLRAAGLLRKQANSFKAYGKRVRQEWKGRTS